MSKLFDFLLYGTVRQKYGRIRIQYGVSNTIIQVPFFNPYNAPVRGTIATVRVQELFFYEVRIITLKNATQTWIAHLSHCDWVNPHQNLKIGSTKLRQKCISKTCIFAGGLQRSPEMSQMNGFSPAKIQVLLM